MGYRLPLSVSRSPYWNDFLIIKFMTPFSYQGFGFTAILVMVGILSAAQLLKYLRERFFHDDREKGGERLPAGRQG
jgi:hypothetical protein